MGGIVSDSTDCITASQVRPEDRGLMAACVRGMRNPHAMTLTTARASQETLRTTLAAEGARVQARLVRRRS